MPGDVASCQEKEGAAADSLLIFSSLYWLGLCRPGLGGALVADVVISPHQGWELVYFLGSHLSSCPL